MRPSQTLQNMAYGMQIRLAVMKRRGEDPAKIEALQKQYDELTEKMKE